MINAEFVGGEGFGSFAPGGIVFVIDDVVGAEGFEDIGFAGRGGRGDDAGAGGFGELDLILDLSSRRLVEV